VSRGCSRGEVSGSLYLADLIAIIEVRGEEVLASTLDGDRMWRQGLGYQMVPSCV
jgi:lipid A disaccharide synthetase